jgi:hypothetical protein
MFVDKTGRQGDPANDVPIVVQAGNNFYWRDEQGVYQPLILYPEIIEVSDTTGFQTEGLLDQILNPFKSDRADPDLALKVGFAYGIGESAFDTAKGIAKIGQLGVDLTGHDRTDTALAIGRQLEGMDIEDILIQLDPVYHVYVEFYEATQAETPFERGRHAGRGTVAAVDTALIAAGAVGTYRSLTANATVAIAGLGDCAACTAARAINEIIPGAEIDAQDLVRNVGLPRKSISGYEEAEAFARHYFSENGLVLDVGLPTFRPVAEEGLEGQYVIFFRGGAEGGHVIYGEVTSSGLRLIDDQLGKSWSSLESAKSQLGLEPKRSYRIKGVRWR